MRKSVLIVIAGPNGSGKTSITSQILQHEWIEDSVYINPDIVAQEKFGDWNSLEAVMQAVRYCEDLREDCLRKRKSLIFETVLSVEDKVDYIYRAKKAGFLSGCFLCVRVLRLLMLRVLLTGLWKGDMICLLRK